MSISAISGSSAYGSLYTQSSTAKKRSSSDDPMRQAIGNLSSTDSALASKLTDMADKVDAMKKSGASESDVQKTIKSTMDGLSDAEKTTLKSAMPAPPSGGPKGPGGPGGPPPAGGPPPSDSDADSDGSSTSFSASSLLDSISSTQNDAIASFMSARASYASAQ